MRTTRVRKIPISMHKLPRKCVLHVGHQMRQAGAELATRISRALIGASTHYVPARTWSPPLEQALHRLGLRDSLSPPLVSRVIDPHLLTHHSLALGFFNWAAQQPGFAHTSLTYQSILKSLSLSRQSNAVISLLKQAKAQRLSLDLSTYRHVISSLIKGRMTHVAFLVFNEVKEQILDVGSEICNSLLAAMGSEGYLENGLKVFDEMRGRGVGFNTIGFGVFMWRFCRTGDLDKVLSMLDEVMKGGNSVVNGSVFAVLIVHGLCEGSRVNETLWVLNELRVRGCKPDFMAYRVVAEAFRLTRSVADVNNVLKMKRKLGVAPRSNDYEEFILSLIAEGCIAEAKELGEIIVNGNFPIEGEVLNALMESVSSMDPGSAMVFFNFSVEKGKSPTPLTVSNFCKNLCKLGKIEQLLEVYRVLSSIDYFFDTESYHVIFSYLCKANRVREAYDILQEMKKKGLGPNISMYNSLMEACCREDLLRPAKRLWDEMFVIGCGVNLRTYNILISKFLEIAEIDEALRLFNHMLEKGVVPDGTTYAFLLEGLCREAKFEHAMDVFNKSVNQDVTLAQSILTTFILSLCGKGQFLIASKLLLGLNDDIGHLDSYVVFLKFLADAKEVAVAVEHVKQIQDTSPLLWKAISTELLALLSSSSNLDSILHLVAVSEQYADSNFDAQKLQNSRLEPRGS